MPLYLGKSLNKRGMSLLEITAMITVVGLAITAVFATVTSGINFSKEAENRIKAVNLAREGIEGVTNLRNTNWLRFSSDQGNCWLVKDYKAGCIGDTTKTLATGYIGALGSVLQNSYSLENKNGAWYLTGYTTLGGLWVDKNGYYVASGSINAVTGKCTNTKFTECQSPFGREIQINSTSSTGSITVTSIVRWNEKGAKNVTLKTTLSNWKSKF